MKKKQTSIILVVAVTVLALIGVLGILMPRIMLNLLIKETLPEFVGAEYITDFTTVADETFEVENEYFRAQILQGFEKTGDLENSKETVFENRESGKKYRIQNMPSDVTMTVNDLDYQSLPESYMNTSDESMLNSLGYATPDSYYNIMKCVSLLDAKDYDKWNMEKIMAYSVYGSIRISLGEVNNYLYEREELCAYIQNNKEIGEYRLEIFRPEDLNTAYVITIENGEMKDVICFLNSINFK